MEAREWSTQPRGLCVQGAIPFRIAPAPPVVGRSRLAPAGITELARRIDVHPCPVPEEEREVCLAAIVEHDNAIPLSQFSSLTRLTRVTACVMRFRNCRARCGRISSGASGPLSIAELTVSETLWLSNAQSHCFSDELEALKRSCLVPAVFMSCTRSWIPLGLSEFIF